MTLLRLPMAALEVAIIAKSSEVQVTPRRRVVRVMIGFLARLATVMHCGLPVMTPS